MKTYPPHGEDKLLMAERARLEAIWRCELTDDDRAAWRAYWTTTPPRDAYGRAYITTPATEWDQLTVTEPTAYAWQNIFDTWRFKAQHHTTPLPRTAPLITSITLQWTATDLRVTITTDPAQPPNGKLILYASFPHGPLKGNGSHRVRPITWIEADPIARTWSILEAYDARWGTPTTGTITASAVTLDCNGAANPCGIYAAAASPFE